MNVCAVYMITLPTGGLYIGASIKVTDRFRHYKNYCDFGRPIAKAIEACGSENCSFDIIEECKPENLLETEKFYIHYMRFLGFKLLNVMHNRQFKIRKEVRMKKTSLEILKLKAKTQGVSLKKYMENILIKEANKE